VGQLQVSSGGGQVVVTQTTIDWQPPVGPGNDGPIQVGGTTATLFYGPGSATPLAPGTLGRIQDLPGGGAGFMTFVTAPFGGPVFDLSGFGMGSADVDCSDDNTPGDSCSPFAGSSFILTFNEPAPGAVSTSVSLSAFGIATDSTGQISNWFGTFTTQIVGRTPSQIQTNIMGGGSETSTYSGEFTARISDIPEPGTMSLLLMGGGLMALAARRRARSR
jgi:hypothetical protein